MTHTPQDLVTAYASAIDTRDVGALLALYEPDVHPLDGFAWRVDDWRAQVELWLGSMRESLGTRTEHVDIVEGADVSGVSMDVLYAGVDHEGVEHRLWNRLTWVLRRHQDAWRIAQEHTSVPLRMADDRPDFRPVD